MENQIKFKEPHVKVHQNGNLELVADWYVHYGSWQFIVPKGFISDGNSVPVIFRWLVPQFGRNTLAGIIHDWLYKSALGYHCPQPDGLIRNVTRRQADIVRLDLCNWCGVHWLQRLASYIGLRIGGRFTWRKHRNVRLRHIAVDHKRLCGLKTPAFKWDNDSDRIGNIRSEN